MPADSDASPSLPLETFQGAKPEKHAEPSSFRHLGKWLRSAMGNKPEGSLKEALEEVLEEHEDSEMAISVEERNLLRNMIGFGELKVGDVVIPRTDISAVPETVTHDELKAHIMEHRHTRIPIYSGTIDNITGFIHMKDFFFALLGVIEFDLQSIVRPILFVPPSMKITDLLVKMRLSSCHMAIVVDEYGCTDGLVTMEDLFEEIVGEIQDEHDEDEEQPAMVWLSEKALEADARVKVSDLEAELQLDLSNGEEEDFDTLGGLIFSHLGRVPAKGEVVHYRGGLKLEVLSADPRRIKKVRVVKTEPLAALEA